MIDLVKKSINIFLNNDKDYTILVGFLSGFYPLLFFYSNNFESSISFDHFLFFGLLFILLPILITFFGYFILSKSGYFKKFKEHFLFIILIELIGIYLSLAMYSTVKKKILFFALILLIFLSIKLHKHYKKIALLLCFMCLFPIYKISEQIIINFSNSSNWQKQPDIISSVKFKSHPNIYYIQPDGYTNANNLNDSIYNFDNSKFDNWLQSKKFTLYNDFRSNYPSTLYSNTSCFFMKHHHFKSNSRFIYERDLILGDNPVLNILKNNKYKTFFLTERPYLLVNRPKIAYDYCNFTFNEVPIFDGWKKYKSISEEIKTQIKNNTKTNNFFFIQKFTPGHISITQAGTLGKEKERLNYLKHIEEANIWLKEIINFIDNNDPNAIIIIAADHGGFVGFEYSRQSQDNIVDEKLLHSIFGAKLAIKWNSTNHYQYDKKLKTSVNLFRVLFSNLSQNKLLLNHLQQDNSYNYIKEDKSYYLAID